jgi:predicted lipid-binding transport protein (Tim44 family)
MKTWIAVGALFLAGTAMLAADLADARRLGGGRSIGAQRQMTPAPSPNTPNAAPSTPSAPAQAAAPKAAPGAAPAAAGASRWLGPIAGIAAAIGLAALLSHLGLSETFASILLLALMIGAAFFLVRWLLARRGAPPARPMQYAGAGAGRVEPTVARPGHAFEPVLGGAAAASVAASPSRFPPGFQPGPFVEQAKLQFRKLQSAYDNGDRKALSEVMTPEMFAEITRELAERQDHLPTEVVRLDAEIMEAVTEGNRHWMSVRFTGLLREDGTVLPKEFDETWNLVKPVDDSSGWLLAGIQQANEVA